MLNALSDFVNACKRSCFVVIHWVEWRMYTSVNYPTLSSHYLNQCWGIINWNHMNKLQWNLKRNLYIFIQENALEISAKWRVFCLGLNVLMEQVHKGLFHYLQYIPRNMHTVFAFLCFVVVIHWLIFPYPSGLLHWHCGNLTIAPVPAKQPRWIRINTSCEFIMNDCITTTKQSTTKPCAYFLGYTVTTRGELSDRDRR